MGAVYKRELKALMPSIYGPACAAILLCVVGLVMFRINLLAGIADASHNLMGYGEYALCLIIPVACMRCVTFDRKYGTDRLYFALPLRTSTVVLGKFFALLTVFALPMGVIALYPLLLRAFGEINLTSAYASIIMFFLLGAALIALCMFVSTLTRYMTVSALAGVSACVALYFLSPLVELLPYTPVVSLIGMGVLAILLIVISWFSSKSLPVTAITAAATVLPLSVLYVLDSFVFKWDAFEGLFPTLISYASPFRQLENVATSGTFDLFGVSIILSFTVFFVFLTVQSTDKRRWA